MTTIAMSMEETLEERHDAIMEAVIINAFFEKSNASTYRCEYPDARAKLLNFDERDSNEEGDSPPILTSSPPPSRDWSLGKLISWAQSYRGSVFSQRNLVVLDERTAQDAESCLCISYRGLPSPSQEGVRQHYQVVRADFESAVINLMTKEMFVGGDEHLDGDYEGFDGVLRNSVRDEWERREYGSKT